MEGVGFVRRGTSWSFMGGGWIRPKGHKLEFHGRGLDTPEGAQAGVSREGAGYARRGTSWSFSGGVGFARRGTSWSFNGVGWVRPEGHKLELKKS
jgi:hypothetical protein